MIKIIETVIDISVYKIDKTDIHKPKTFKYEPIDRYIVEYTNDNGVHRMFELTEEQFLNYKEFSKSTDLKEVHLEEVLMKKENELIEMDLVSFNLLLIKRKD